MTAPIRHICAIVLVLVPGTVGIGGGLPAQGKVAQVFRPYFGAADSRKIEEGVNLRLGRSAASPEVLLAAEKTVAWAAMESLKPDETARALTAMSWALMAGFRFDEAEDLIPVVARREMDARDFLFYLRYYKEAAAGRVPEQTRQLFLSRALERDWDGLSLLAGGRGLLIARADAYDVNRAAKRMLRVMPRSGFASGSEKLAGAVRQSLPYRKTIRNERFLSNLLDVESGAKSRNLSGTELAKSLRNAGAIDADVQDVSEVNLVPRPHVGGEDPADPDFIREDHEESGVKKDWQNLSEAALQREVKSWLGVPYLWGGETRKGVDCTGLTREVLSAKKIGVPRKTLPHSGDQAGAGRATDKANLRTGDVLFFSASPKEGKITHAGLALSPTTFVHARVDGVRMDKMSDVWWGARFVTARRLFDRVQK